MFAERDLSEERLAALEGDIDRCIKAMGDLHKQARQIPRIVQALSAMHNKPMQPMGAALKRSSSKAARYLRMFV